MKYLIDSCNWQLLTKSTYSRLPIIFFLLVFAFFSSARAEAPVFLFDGSNIEIDGKHIGILEDKSSELKLSDVIRSNGFSSANQEIPNLMISKSTFWAKIQITNKSEDERLFIEYPYPIVDHADLYTVLPDGKISLQELGEKIPINKRKYRSPSFVYDLHIPINQTRTVFLQIKNTQQIMLPLKVGNAEAIFNSVSRKDIFSSIYAGIIVVMFLYNLFIFYATRDKSYVYYSAYILLAGITHISHHGYTYKLLWPGSPLLAEWSVALSPALVGIAGALFVRDFLQTKIYSKKFHRFYDVLLVLYVICISLFFLGFKQFSYQLSQATAMVLSVAIITTSAVVARRGYRPAKYFFYGFTVFLSSLIIFILKDFGLFPYNELTVYCLEIGSSAELILLSFALGDKINILKKEKEDSQAKTVEALRENERIMREQNVILESKVKERTHELQKSNSDLSVAIMDLKEAQSQLVDAEKMASLGQLTAGIAHEINNPINFVVSNINPLKRDIDDILQVLAKYAEIKDANDINGKLNEVNELMEQLDLSYVMEEINLLLKGIDDGANRTAEIVKSLRTFSRLDETDLKKADINEGIESTLVLLNSSSAHGVEFVKKYEVHDPIECYAGKLNQLFMNVLKNAMQAVAAKQYGQHEKPMITIVTKDLQEEILISIKDNGTGMDEATQARIFEPFFTTKDLGEGTGLGLSIVYSIIEKHNGLIEVESQQGIDTEFMIYIPKYQYKTDDKEKIKTLKAERRSRMLKQYKRINN